MKINEKSFTVKIINKKNKQTNKKQSERKD